MHVFNLLHIFSYDDKEFLPLKELGTASYSLL